MSDYRDKMRRRMEPRGTNEGESLWSNTTEFANKNFHKSPTFRRMGVQSFEYPDIKEIDARVMKIERMGDIREVLFRPYEGVNIGTYLFFDDEIWLVYDKYGSRGSGKVKVLVERCTEKVRWKDAAGTYHEEYCIASATQLGSKANQGKNMLEWNKYDVRLPLGQLFVFVEKNPTSSQIAMSQRFIFGSNAYEVLGIDDVTSTGVEGFGYIQITVGITPKSDQDDFETKIAFNKYDNPLEEVPADGLMSGLAVINEETEEKDNGGGSW